MKKGKIAAEIILLAVLCLCFISGYKEGADIKEDGLSDGNVRVLSWFSDMPLWYPEEWEKDPGTGTGKITEQTGVAINYMVPDDNGDSRLSLMMINGKLPDIKSVSDTNMIRHLIESGEVWKIEELMNTYLPDSHLLADYPEDVKKELIRRDGDWYGLSSELHSPLNQKKYGEPEEFYRELLQLGNRCGIIWNKALLKRLGFSPNGPRTEEEILEIFEMVMEKEITVNAKPVIPLLVDGRNYQETTFPVLLSFFGAGWVDEEGGYQERIMADGSRHAIRFLNQMVQEGYVEPEQFIMTPYNVKRTLNAGQVLCFIGDMSRSGIDPEEWVSSGVIRSSDGNKPVLGLPLKTGCGEMTTFISKSCEYPEEAALWLDYMTGTEGMSAYLASSRGSWWPLVDVDWYMSIQHGPDAKLRAWKQLLCAFARTPETRIYDSSGLGFSLEERELREKETAVRGCVKAYLNPLIMAESEEKFEEEYENFRKELQERGIGELEERKAWIYRYREKQ